LPELPEVETVVRSLKSLKNKKIVRIKYYSEKVAYNFQISKINKILKGRTFKSISRKGKYIIFNLKEKYLICHLRMTGYLYLSKTLPIKKNHIRCIFLLDDNQFLIFGDIRKFGGFYLYNNLNELNSKIGIDPFNIMFTESWLENNLSTKKRMIKHLLLDQKFICGLGNIYIDEILWKTQVSPKTLSHSITSSKNLYNSILSILNDSIKFHGTTIMNFKFGMGLGIMKTKIISKQYLI